MNTLLDDVRGRSLARDGCFLCGTSDGDLTDEHVFPRWLLERFNLWTMRMQLISGTEIEYRRWTVRCCTGCNSTHLKRIEDAISQATLLGRAAVASLPEEDLFLWPAKIVYGSLFKMSSLRRSLDLSDGSGETIISRGLLASFERLLFLLQACRVPLHMPGGFPSSVMVFDTQVPSEVRKRFFYYGKFWPPFIVLRIGAVGLIAALEDGGALKAGFSTFLDKCERTALHPLQFLEVAARMYYQLSLLETGPTLLTVSGVESAVAFNLDWHPTFRPHVQADYARDLASFMRVRVQDIYQPETDAVASLVMDPNENVTYMSLEDFPEFPSGFGRQSRPR